MTVTRVGTRFDEAAALGVWQQRLGREGRPPSAARIAQARRALGGRNALFLVAEQEGRVTGMLLAELSTEQPGRLELAMLFGEDDATEGDLMAALTSRYPVTESPAAQADPP